MLSTVPCNHIVKRGAQMEIKYSLNGLADRAMHFAENKQLLDAGLWRCFVNQFKGETDKNDRGWRGEFWGKMMRGASLVYGYTGNEELYNILEDTVRDMISVTASNGRISSYSVETEFNGWDMWCRKYVILGMEYFLEICKDEALKVKIIDCIKKQADYIMAFIGDEEGKTPIVFASGCWRGLNSSSILEPIVRLYKLTGEKKYLDFAEHIVGHGGTSIADIFELAWENSTMPYQFPVTKAYEMTSCFEGLLEYAEVTGNEKWKQAVINYAYKVIETDFTVIGSAGCTHELFDHSTVRQANTTNGFIMQETCVTVTLMKFFGRILNLTGDSRFADAIERSFYNAYLGAENPNGFMDDRAEGMQGIIKKGFPYDSYAPLTRGRRGRQAGGFMILEGGNTYGCCASIASVGIGTIPKIMFIKSDDGFSLNFYENGRIETKNSSGSKFSINIETKYPVEGDVKIRVEENEADEFTVNFRIPAWSRVTTARLNGEEIRDEALNEKPVISASDLTKGSGYLRIKRKWKKGDEVSLTFDMRTFALYPIAYGEDMLINNMLFEYDYLVPTHDIEDKLAKRHIALERGPLMLATEELPESNGCKEIDFETKEKLLVNVLTEKEDADSILEAEVKTSTGNLHLKDYASAGKDKKKEIAVWLLTK